MTENTVSRVIKGLSMEGHCIICQTNDASSERTKPDQVCSKSVEFHHSDKS